MHVKSDNPDDRSSIDKNVVYTAWDQRTRSNPVVGQHESTTTANDMLVSLRALFYPISDKFTDIG